MENLIKAKSLADIAVHAARKMKMSGRYAMARYAMKRGVSAELLIMAMCLGNVK